MLGDELTTHRIRTECLVHTVCLTNRIPQAMNIHLILSIVNSCTFCTILAAASYLQIGFSHNSQSHRKIESRISTTSISQYTKDGGSIITTPSLVRIAVSAQNLTRQANTNNHACIAGVSGWKAVKTEIFHVLGTAIRCCPADLFRFRNEVALFLLVSC